MAFVTHTVTGDLRQMFGADIDTTQVVGKVETNLTPGMVMVYDLDNETQRLGSGELTINTDGTWTLSGVPSWDNTEADQNPTHVQIQVRFEYNDKVTRQRTKYLTGFLEIDHDGSIGEFVAQQLAPADWRSDFMDQAETLLAQQEQIAGLANSDAAQAYNVDHGPLTGAALAASIDASIAVGVPPLIAVEVPPLVAAAIADDPTVALAAADAVDDALATEDILVGTDQRAAKLLPPESGYAYAILDSAGRAGLLIRPNGNIVGRFELQAGAVTQASLDATMATLVPTTMPPESGYLWAVADSAGRVGVGVTNDGSLYAAKTTFPTYSSRLSGNTGYVAQVVKDALGHFQIITTRRSDGKRFTVTADASNHVEPFITVDNKLLYRTDATGVMVDMVMPVEGGTAWALTSGPSIYVLGDSYSAGAGTSGTAFRYGNVMAVTLGVTVTTDAIGGQGIEQIAARGNGAPAHLTVTSNQIPASGPVTVTALDVQLLNIATTGTASRTGTLAGVPGTLLMDNTSGVVYTFTRTTPGSVVACPAGTPFYTDNGVNNQGSLLSLWTGRNSFTSRTPAQLVASAQSQIDYMKPYLRRFGVLQIPPFVGEETGAGAAPRGANRDALDAANAAYLAAWPGNYINVADYLQSAQAAIDASISYTSQDLLDIANGLTPTSFRSDTGHLNDLGYTLVGRYVAGFYTAKGWY